MDATPLTDGLQADKTLTLAEAKDEALVPPSSLLSAPEISLNVPAVVIDSTAPNPEKPEDGGELHQLDEDPASPVISKNEVAENDTEEKRYETEEEGDTEEKKSETEEKGTEGREKDNEENESETEAKLDTGGKKNDKEKNIINSEPVKTVVLRHGKPDQAKVNPREQHVTEAPAKGSDVLENVPEECTSKITRPVVSRQGSADVPRTKVKRRYDVVNEQTKENVTSHLEKMVRDSERGNSDGPTNKRQRILSTPGDSGGRVPPNPSSGRMDGDGISYSDLKSSGPTASLDEDDDSLDEDDGSVDVDAMLDEMTQMDALPDDEDVDPTFYGFNREEHSLLHQKCARAFARFTAASMCARPDEREFEEENNNLEKCRAELLRILVMVPRGDRTTLWTNMGQPDVRTLLGLLPEVPSSNQPDESTVSQQAGAEVVPQRNRSTMGLSPMQSEQASPTSASTMQILQRGIGLGRPKPIPVPPPPSMRAQNTASQTMFPPSARSIPPRRGRCVASHPRNAFRTGPIANSSRVLPSVTTQGPAHRGSTSATQIDSLATPRQQRPEMSTQRSLSEIEITCETSFSIPPPSSRPYPSRVRNTFQDGSYSRILPSAQLEQTYRGPMSAIQQDNLTIMPWTRLPFTSGRRTPPHAMNPFQTPWIAPTRPFPIHASHIALQRGSSSFPQGPTRPAPYYQPVACPGRIFRQRMDNGYANHRFTRPFDNTPHVSALEHRSDTPAGGSDTLPEWLARGLNNGTTSAQNLAANIPTGREFDIKQEVET